MRLSENQEAKMELLKLSKFKLQLQALVTESRDLRERERSATEQIHQLIQKQKHTEEELCGKLQELQVELSSCNELREKLERKVNYLQNDNALLENKQKELKGTINGLLQSRDDFVNAYQESTYKMKSAIEERDRKLTVLAEKLKSHLSLFDSIVKEASSIKQVVDEVQRVVCQKEDIVAGLKSKMDQVSAYEKVSVEKINEFEYKVKTKEAECQRKDKVVWELEAQLEVARISNDSFQTQIQELQKTALAKDVVIQNLISEKEALHFQAGNLAVILQKIQKAVTRMDEEIKGSSLQHWRIKMNVKLKPQKIAGGNDYWIQDVVPNSTERSPFKSPKMDPAANKASPQGQEDNSTTNPLQENKNVNSCCGFEVVCSPQHSTRSEPHAAANVLNLPVNNEKDDCEMLTLQLDSKFSTSGEEESEDMG